MSDPAPEASVVTDLVLHILPEDMARGAQSYARALVDHLDAPSQPHRLASLFRSGPANARPDFELNVPMGPMRSAGLHPLVLWRLRRLVQETDPSVIVAHGGESAKYAAVVKGRRPMIYLMIGTTHPKLARVTSRWLYRMTLNRSARVVVVSQALAREAESQHGIDRGRTVVIANGRDETVFKPGTRSGTGPPRLGWVGNLDEAKRPTLFIEAVAALRARGSGVSAWMAGGGSLRDAIEREGAARDVEVLGERSDVAQLLSSSDLFVFTGRPPEGMPGVLIEAAMCGLPVVTTDVPGAAEVVEDGVTGYVVGIDDREALIGAIQRLVDDRELREELGQAARARAVELFSLPKSLDKWRALISDVRR